MTTPEPDAPAPDTALSERVGKLETGQASILDKLDQLLGGGHEPDPEPERPELSIAEEIRAQLDERDRKARSKPAKPAAPAATELAEKPPRAPVRRVTRALWGDDD